MPHVTVTIKVDHRSPLTTGMGEDSVEIIVEDYGDSMASLIAATAQRASRRAIGAVEADAGQFVEQ